MTKDDLIEGLIGADAALDVGVNMGRDIMKTTNNAQQIFVILLSMVQEELLFHKKVCEYLLEEKE